METGNVPERRGVLLERILLGLDRAATDAIELEELTPEDEDCGVLAYVLSGISVVACQPDHWGVLLEVGSVIERHPELCAGDG